MGSLFQCNYFCLSNPSIHYISLVFRLIGNLFKVKKINKKGFWPWGFLTGRDLIRRVFCPGWSVFLSEEVRSGTHILEYTDNMFYVGHLVTPSYLFFYLNPL